MKNLIIIDELKGIDIPAGSEVQYDPRKNMYVYEYKEKSENRTYTSVQEYSPDFFEPYIKSGKVQEIGEDKFILQPNFTPFVHRSYWYDDSLLSMLDTFFRLK
jgi:hypothetical protein